MKVITFTFMLLVFVSCSHHTHREEMASPPWFVSHPENYSKRTPAQSSRVENLEEFIQEFSEAASIKTVPVGHEETESRFKNGKTEIRKRVYLKQNEHGYFDLTLDDQLDSDLWSNNFETNVDRFITSVRNTAETGRLTKITKNQDGVYELKGRDEDHNFCTSVYDFVNRVSPMSICLNSRGEVQSKIENTLKKVDLSEYEDKLRNTTIIICSNVLKKEDGPTNCEKTSEKRDWWAFLFEEK